MHPVSNNRISFGDLVSKASNLPLPENPTIKQDKFYLIGKPVQRWDTGEKINGSATYGADVELPNLLYGTVVHAPILGSKITKVDDAKAKAFPGYLAAIPFHDQVVVVANSTWSAFKSTEMLTIETEGGFPSLSDEIISKKLQDDAKKEGVAAGNRLGNVEEAFKNASTVIEYEYTLPIQAHACMEPLTATANVVEDSCEFWVPIQSQDVPVLVAMQAAGSKPEKVKVHTTYLGGGFGRKVEADYVIALIVASKLMNRSVKVNWSREADMRGGVYRPPTLVKLKAGLDADTLPIGIKAKVVAPSAS